MHFLSSDWQALLIMTAQIGAALLAGGLIGLERSYHGRAAGFRTFSLVALGSCLLMVAISYPSHWYPPVENSWRLDPSRVMQGIATGVGFLGAGVIFRDGFTVRGLTTAACIWVVSAIGVMFGIGLYWLGLVGTVITLVVLSLFKQIETMLPSNQYSYLTISFERDYTPNEADFRQRLLALGVEAQEMGYGISPEGALFEYHATLRTAHTQNVQRLAEELRHDTRVIRFKLSPTTD